MRLLICALCAFVVISASRITVGADETTREIMLPENVSVLRDRLIGAWHFDGTAGEARFRGFFLVRPTTKGPYLLFNEWGLIGEGEEQVSYFGSGRQTYHPAANMEELVVHYDNGGRIHETYSLGPFNADSTAIHGVQRSLGDGGKETFSKVCIEFLGEGRYRFTAPNSQHPLDITAERIVDFQMPDNPPTAEEAHAFFRKYNGVWEGTIVVDGETQTSRWVCKDSEGAPIHLTHALQGGGRDHNGIYTLDPTTHCWTGCIVGADGRRETQWFASNAVSAKPGTYIGGASYTVSPEGEEMLSVFRLLVPTGDEVTEELLNPETPGKWLPFWEAKRVK